jgi:copper transport protein
VSGSTAKVGPGPVVATVVKSGYRLEIHVTPNRAAVPNDFAVRLSRAGQPVRGADVVLRFTMLDMEMGQQEYRLQETVPGLYTHAAPALVMVGHWGLSFDVTPAGRAPFDVLVVDRAAG